MPRHTLVAEVTDLDQGRLTVSGEEAKHALRVKRVREGESVRVLDGKGSAWLATVVEARKQLVLELGEREELAAIRPRVEVASATPKGGRVDKMIDQLGQLGVASWRPLSTRLGVVEPGENKLDRLRRIAGETVKQALLPRPLEIGEEVSLEAAFRWEGEAAARSKVVVADPMGERYEATGAERIRIVVGPEGGFTEKEYAAMSGMGVRLVSLGPTVLRIETAAVAAAAVVLHAERAVPDATGGVT